MQKSFLDTTGSNHQEKVCIAVFLGEKKSQTENLGLRLRVLAQLYMEMC